MHLILLRIRESQNLGFVVLLQRFILCACVSLCVRVSVCGIGGGGVKKIKTEPSIFYLWYGLIRLNMFQYRLSFQNRIIHSEVSQSEALYDR